MSQRVRKVDAGLAIVEPRLSYHGWPVSPRVGVVSSAVLAEHGRLDPRYFFERGLVRERSLGGEDWEHWDPDALRDAPTPPQADAELTEGGGMVDLADPPARTP